MLYFMDRNIVVGSKVQSKLTLTKIKTVGTSFEIFSAYTEVYYVQSEFVKTTGYIVDKSYPSVSLIAHAEYSISRLCNKIGNGILHNVVHKTLNGVPCSSLSSLPVSDYDIWWTVYDI
jgi:hypothetical protein